MVRIKEPFHFGFFFHAPLVNVKLCNPDTPLKEPELSTNYRIQCTVDFQISLIIQNKIFLLFVGHFPLTSAQDIPARAGRTLDASPTVKNLPILLTAKICGKIFVMKFIYFPVKRYIFVNDRQRYLNPLTLDLLCQKQLGFFDGICSFCRV